MLPPCLRQTSAVRSLASCFVMICSSLNLDFILSPLCCKDSTNLRRRLRSSGQVKGNEREAIDVSVRDCNENGMYDSIIATLEIELLDDHVIDLRKGYSILLLRRLVTPFPQSGLQH